MFLYQNVKESQSRSLHDFGTCKENAAAQFRLVILKTCLGNVHSNQTQPYLDWCGHLNFYASAPPTK